MYYWIKRIKGIARKLALKMGDYNYGRVNFA